MANKQLLDYIQRALAENHSSEQINSALLEQGWTSTEINGALAKAQEIINKKTAVLFTPSVPPKKSEWSIEFKSLTATQMLLYIGGLIVVLAGITYIGISWEQWKPVARIFAILLPLLICYSAGTPLFLKGYKKQGIIFLATGALLFPLFLIGCL